MKIELTEELHRNLMMFLTERCTLKGNESVTHVKLLQALNPEKQNGRKPEEVEDAADS